jgi:hypothetical protein
VATSARGQTAKGIGPGSPASRLRGHANSLGGGLWTSRLGGATVAYVVRGGAVRTVALAGPAAASGEAALRGYLGLVPRRGVAARPTRVVGAAPPGVAPGKVVPLGVDHGSSQFPYTLHGSGQFPFFCGL